MWYILSSFFNTVVLYPEMIVTALFVYKYTLLETVTTSYLKVHFYFAEVVLKWDHSQKNIFEINVCVYVLMCKYVIIFLS